MLFFYIRHGMPIYDPDSLTPLGLRQAEAVGRRLAIHGIDRVYASTSTRAIQTATPCAEITGREITQLDWCNESHAWAQLTTIVAETGRKTWGFAHLETRRVFNLPEVRRLGEEWYRHPYFEGTQYEAGINRIRREADAFFESLGYRHDRENGVYIQLRENNERVALFAHQGFGLAFLASVLDIPYPTFCTRCDLSHSSMTVIEFREQDGVVIPKMLQMANDSHLYKESLPTNYNGRAPV